MCRTARMEHGLRPPREDLMPTKAFGYSRWEPLKVFEGG